MRNTLLALLIITATACGGSGGGSSSTAETRSCKSMSGSHSGCCSSHGGIYAQCASGQTCYTSGGAVVCNDGTVSPSCTFSKPIPEYSETLLRDDEHPATTDLQVQATCN